MRPESLTFRALAPWRLTLGVIGPLLLLMALMPIHVAAETAAIPIPNGAKQEAVRRVHGTLREIHAANISAVEKREQLQRVMQQHPYIFRNSNIDPLNERVHWRNYQTRLEAQQDVLNYITMFYNSQRLHSYLDYMSPNQYEAEMVELKKAA